MADDTSSCLRVNGTTTRGCTPASITITSAPSPSRPRKASASRWAWTNRDGHTSVAFMEAELSSTIATRLLPWPMTVMAGRASATVSQECQDLQQQERVPLQALEEGRRLAVAKGGVPQEQARHPHLTTPHLEEIEQQQRHRQR